MINAVKSSDDIEYVPQVEAPQVAASLQDLHIPASVVSNLVLKHLAAEPKVNLLKLTQKLGINSNIIESILTQLRAHALVEVLQPELNSNKQHGNVRYQLSNLGEQEATRAIQKDAYIGPVPVAMSDYQHMVVQQDLHVKPITQADVNYALRDVYGAPILAEQLGPAINSGRAMLLYGHAGTGKSYVANLLIQALRTSVYIPYAVYAAGNVIRIFSSHHHRPLDHNFSNQEFNFKQHYDRRWVLCSRPMVQVGGELKMDMLEVNHSENNRAWMAPLQMMANNGLFVIDDFGRQTMPIETLLNRWIVPMEYKVDHLSLPNGQQTTIPFVLSLAFSTNLSPSQIGDPAFLRRLGYKIQFYPLHESDYKDLWFDYCEQLAVELDADSFRHLLQLHQQHQVPLLPCLPKDLVGICRDVIRYQGLARQLTPELVDKAWGIYFSQDEDKGGAQ